MAALIVSCASEEERSRSPRPAKKALHLAEDFALGVGELAQGLRVQRLLAVEHRGGGDEEKFPQTGIAGFGLGIELLVELRNELRQIERLSRSVRSERSRFGGCFERCVDGIGKCCAGLARGLLDRGKRCGGDGSGLRREDWSGRSRRDPLHLRRSRPARCRRRGGLWLRLSHRHEGLHVALRLGGEIEG
jgi:hypothetical protein